MAIKNKMIELEQIKILLQNPSVKVVSFDIFDTILVRPVYAPTDVFYLLKEKAKTILNDNAVDFYQIRLTAENEARIELSKKNPVYGEITLSQIYDYIARKYNFDEDTKDKLKQVEIEIETTLLRPRKFAQEIFNLATNSGKRVVLVSDFYFEKEVLENVLNIKGISGYKQLYVSSELKKRKDTGELYKAVFKAENIEPWELFHIGDNYNSDVICALDAGAVAFHLPSNSEIFISREGVNKKIWEEVKSFSPSERILFGFGLNQAAQDIVDNPDSFDAFSNKFMMGYFGLGSFTFSLAHYILKSKSIQDHYQNIYFASRDGYLPKIIYDLLRNGHKNYLESRYIYCGRQAYDISKYDGDVFSYLSNKTNHMGKYTLVNLFDALVEKDFLQNKYSQKWLDNTYFDTDKKNGFPKLTSIVTKHQKEIKKILDQRKKVTEDYYKSEIQLNQDKRALIFDTGYSGSVSEGIGPLINGFIDKLYLWQTKKNEIADEKNNTKSFVLCGFQDEKNERPSVFLAIEELFSPLENACIGFEKDENNNILPCFKNNEDFSQNMCESLVEIQNGVISFVNDIISIMGGYLYDLELTSIHKLLESLYLAFSSPTDNSIHLLDDIIFNDNYSRSEQVSLTTKIEEKNSDYFHRTKFLDERLISSSEGECLIENDLKIGVHLHLYNVDYSSLYVKHLMYAPYKFSLFISVVDAKYKKIAECYFNSLAIPNAEQIVIKVFQNRGRDVAPWLVGFKEELKQCDVVCHIHTKKSMHFAWGNSWNGYLTDNLISPVAFKEIINRFNRQKDIGVVFPPIYKGIYKFWIKNSFSHMGINNLLNVCKDVLQKMKINKVLDRNSVYFSVGNMFWYRREALVPLLNLDLGYEDFPPEPIPVDGTIAHAIERLHTIVAEHQGYKTISYIKQDYLINEFHNHVLVDTLDADDYKNKVGDIFTDLLYVYLEQKRYFDAVLLAFRIYRENFITTLVQKSTIQIQNLVREKIKQDGWNQAIRENKLNEIDKYIKKRDYDTAKNMLNTLLNYEPMHVESLKRLLDISIKEKNIFLAAELNNLLISILPTLKEVETKRMLKVLVKEFLQKKAAETNTTAAVSEEAILPKNIKVDDMLVSIVIVTFNQYEYTKKCLDSINEFTNENYEIIVVDNNSKDGTPDKIKNDFPEIKLIENAENKGFPLAANQGIKEGQGEYYLLLNNDTIVTQNWLERIIDVAESNPATGIVGPISNQVSGVQIDQNAKYDSIEEMHKYAAKIKMENAGKYFEFPRVAFLCTLIKREVIEKIGGLDERFSPGNFEDDDFCLRAQLAGYKTVVAQDVFIHHYGSKSFKANGVEEYAKRLDLNKQIFIDKWGADPEEIWLKGKSFKRRNPDIPIDTNLFVENMKRAMIYLTDKDFQQASICLNEAIDSFDKYPKTEFEHLELIDLLELAGNASLMNSNLEKAQEYFGKELEINPTSSRACLGLAEVFLAAEMFVESKTMFEWAVKNDSSNTKAREGLKKINIILKLEEEHNSLERKN
jgi:GT2 family glycosyltransferase/predicted HAD superfamily hydrolase